MERISKRIAMALMLMFAIAAVAMSAPKSERAGKYLKVEGRVLQINDETRTLLVLDQWSKKLYYAKVPKGATFLIKFGMNANRSESAFDDVNRNDRVLLRCIRTSEHLAHLGDGREVVMLSVAE